MLREALNTALESAETAEDQCKQHTLKLILTAIRDQDIAARESGADDGLSDPQISQILKTMITQRQSAIADHEESGKIDLVEWENREIEIIKEFMPKSCNDMEAVTVCRQVIQDLGATGLKDIGKTVDTLRDRMGDRIDFGRAKNIARELLV